MPYLVGALLGWVVGAGVGVLVALPMMLWGPDADDALAAPWLFVLPMMCAPVGIGLGLFAATGAWARGPLGPRAALFAVVGAAGMGAVVCALYGAQLDAVSLCATLGAGALSGAILAYLQRTLRRGP